MLFLTVVYLPFSGWDWGTEVPREGCSLSRTLIKPGHLILSAIQQLQTLDLPDLAQDPHLQPNPNLISPAHTTHNLQIWARTYILCTSLTHHVYPIHVIAKLQAKPNPYVLCSVLAYCTHIKNRTSKRCPHAQISSQKHK